MLFVVSSKPWNVVLRRHAGRRRQAEPRRQRETAARPPGWRRLRGKELRRQCHGQRHSQHGSQRGRTGGSWPSVWRLVKRNSTLLGHHIMGRSARPSGDGSSMPSNLMRQPNFAALLVLVWLVVALGAAAAALAADRRDAARHRRRHAAGRDARVADGPGLLSGWFDLHQARLQPPARLRHALVAADRCRAGRRVRCCSSCSPMRPTPSG